MSFPWPLGYVSHLHAWWVRHISGRLKYNSMPGCKTKDICIFLSWMACLNLVLFPCRTSVPTLRFGRLGPRHGSARRYFRVTVTWQLQATREPNLAAILRPTVPSTKRIWTTCFEADLTTSKLCRVSGNKGAERTHARFVFDRNVRHEASWQWTRLCWLYSWRYDCCYWSTQQKF